jgi:hypothetical protein
MKGGARPGAGRKPKADEEKARSLCIAAIKTKYGSVEQGLIKLLESEEPSLQRFVFEHAIGKPREKMDVDMDAMMITWHETKTYETKGDE